MSELRVLLVEDDEDHVFLIRRAMREVDGVAVAVQVASSGDDAVRYLDFRRELRGAQPDIVVLDLRLPRMSGFDVLRSIRENPAFSAMPVVVLSSSEHPDDRDQAKALGADDYLCKPLDGGQLRNQVQDLIRRFAVPEAV